MVWGVILTSLSLAKYVELGFGLIAVYLVIGNAMVHIIHAILFKSYNPGLGTAVLIFLPLGVHTRNLLNA